MQCTSALLCLNDCGKSHMFIDSFVHHHFRDSFFLYSLPASCTWTFRGSPGLSDLPSIDVQHLVCGSLFWRYWHIPKLWKIGKSIRPANTTQYGKTEFLASQNSARIPNEPVEMQSQEPKGPKKWSCKILPRWRSLFITRTSLRIWLLPMVTSFRSWCSFNFKGPRKVKGDQWSASNEQDEQALRILARKLISPFSKTFEASLTRPLLQKADFAEIRLTLSLCDMAWAGCRLDGSVCQAQENCRKRNTTLIWFFWSSKGCSLIRVMCFGIKCLHSLHLPEPFKLI